MSRSLFLSFVLLALASMAFAQATTSTLAGTITTEGNPLPGATVTVTSPSLLGTRATVTGPNGGYALAALPPGSYSITFELEGMQTINRRAELKLAETGRSDADLKVSAVAESITVTATTPSVLETPQISTHLEAGLIEDLAIGRRIQDRIQLAPGVVNSGRSWRLPASRRLRSDLRFCTRRLRSSSSRSTPCVPTICRVTGTRVL